MMVFTGTFPGKASSNGHMARDDLQLLQGTLDVLVLKAVSRGPCHGYDIARWIRETTDAELQVEDRALYVALHRMEERQWLEAEWGLTENNRQAKYYQLTRDGRKQLAAKTATWSRYAAAVAKILQTA
jgi:PadR family transcriptional regulator PadR